MPWRMSSIRLGNLLKKRHGEYAKFLLKDIPGPDDLPTEIVHPICIIDSGYAQTSYPTMLMSYRFNFNKLNAYHDSQGSNSGNPFSMD